MKTENKIDLLIQVQSMLNNNPNQLAKSKQHETEIEPLISITRFESQRSIEQFDATFHSFDDKLNSKLNDVTFTDDEPDSAPIPMGLLLAQETKESIVEENKVALVEGNEVEVAEELDCFEFEINSKPSPYHSSFFSQKNILKVLRNYV